MSYGVPRYVFAVILRAGFSALTPCLSLGSGAGLIFMRLALASSVLRVTIYRGAVVCPTAPACSHCISNALQPTGHLHSCASIPPPRGHAPRADRAPMRIRELTA
eukprot:5728846-Pyramimonas_sp.AAC.1